MPSIPVRYEKKCGAWDWPLQQNDGIVHIKNTRDKFEVRLNVQFFKPNEIEVKVPGSDILINCRHESRGDGYGSVSREIFRTYKLPSDVDATTVKSQLSSQGVLTITGYKK